MCVRLLKNYNPFLYHNCLETKSKRLVSLESDIGYLHQTLK